MDLLSWSASSSSSSSSSSSYSSSNRSSSSSSCSDSSSDSDGGGDKRDASNAKQDPSIRRSIIAEQMDVDPVHDRANIIEEEDRISNLSVDIIYRILSFLDMKYAIQTSTLSKKWKHIWKSMPNLNLNSQTSRTLPQFIKFVNDVLSHRNRRTEVSAVELSFRGGATPFDVVVRRIGSYAYSHNVSQLTIEWFRLNEEDQVFKFPQHLFSCHTLKYLTLATHYLYGYGLSLPKSAWDFPALETLYLSNLALSDCKDENFNLFSKCVKLKELTLHQCAMYGLSIFNVCAPQLSNLTVTNTIRFPKVFNVVAPQLENFTASVKDWSSNFLRLSTEGLDLLQTVNLSMRRTPLCSREGYAPELQDLFQKLGGSKFLILDESIIEVLSACLNRLWDQPCPFNNLKCFKQKDGKKRMPTTIRKYLLESSPSATFITDLPQVPRKRSRQEVDKGTMAKEVSKALSPCTNQLSHGPSSFNNLKCLNQTESIPTSSTKVKNQLLESSPNATFDMDSPQVPHKRSRQEADKGTMVNSLVEETQQTKTVDDEKRILEEKIQMQDETIAEQKVMLESMKLQHEKRMLEAKIEMQDKIIAQQKKEMLEVTAQQKEAMKLLHENAMLEEKMQMHDKVIAEQKAMLETMKLQNEKKTFEAKIQRQEKIIAQQKVMMEEMKLQHEKSEDRNGAR